MMNDKDEEIARLAALVQDLEQQNDRFRKENSFLQATASTLNMNINLAEASLRCAMEHVDAINEQMKVLHEQYRIQLTRAQTDPLGFQREPKGTEWESN